MARLKPQKFNLGDINSGERFENGQMPEEIAFNAPIEGSAYAIEQAEQAQAKADQALHFAFGSVGTFSPLLAYPIGAYYQSNNPTSPAQLFGGSWISIRGKFLLAEDDDYPIGTEGGSADAVVVEHNHRGIYYNAVTSERRISPDYYDGNPTVTGGGTMGLDTRIQGTNNFETGYSGESGTGKNMPPYISAYTWRRVS